MPPKHRAGGCGCCDYTPPCERFDDDFNRASLGGDWSTTNWSIVSNKASCSTSDDFCLTTASHTGSHRIEALITISAGNPLSFIIAYTDANNYVKCEYTPGSPGQLEISETVSGGPFDIIDTQSATFTSGGYIHVCYHAAQNGESAYVTAELPHVNANFAYSLGDHDDDIARGPVSLSAGKVGFLSGTLSGTVTVDDFTVRAEGSGCAICTCHCSLCLQGTGPQQMDATLAGWANPSPNPESCTCTDNNDDYVLQCQGNSNCSWEWGGTWHHCDSECVGSTNSITMFIVKVSGTYYLRAYTRCTHPASPNWIVYWEKNMGATAPDCWGLSSEVLTYSSSLSNITGMNCDPTSSTLTVSTGVGA